MQKVISATCLVAGTAIGAGTIALPLVLAKIGLGATTFLMLGTWALCYYTALMGIELNLRAGHGLTLGELGAKFSGPKARWIGTTSLLFLCYGLLCAYLNGVGSVLTDITAHLGYNISAYTWTKIVCVMLFFTLIYGVKLVLHMNKYLFYVLLGGFAFIILWLIKAISLSDISFMVPNQQQQISSWTIAIPVLLTSFGFHVIFHTLARHLNKDKVLLKKAFFWGTFIPACVYIIWTLGILLFIAQKSPNFYHGLVFQGVSVGDLVGELGILLPNAHLLIWMISLFAILTSLLGVGIALNEQLLEKFSKTDESNIMSRVIITLATVIPAYLVAIYVPDAFIKALGFAGMILVVIAILLPLYLLHRSDDTLRIKNRKSAYPILNHTLLRGLVGVIGIGIILAELYNMVLTNL